MNAITRQQPLSPARSASPAAAAPAPAAEAAPSQDVQDVIVIKPETAHSKGMTNTATSAQVVKDLERQGAKVEDSFTLLPGASARIDRNTINHLKDEGYLVYDNSPRKMVPTPPDHKSHHAKQPKDPQPQDDGGSDAAEPAAHRPEDVPPTPLEMPKVDVPALLRSDKVNQAGFTGKGVNVAVIDSGYNHPDVPLVDWHDFVDGSKTPIDPVGHGTHCASDVKTTAPDAGIVAIRVMNEKGEGRPSDIIRGIQWAIAHKDKDHIGVINLSLGGPNDGTPAGEDPLDRAVEAAWKAGIVVVSAAGNDGPAANTVGAPGDDPVGISVGAALDPKHVSWFSSVGPGADGTSKPDITAPGEFIVGWSVPDSEMDDTARMMVKLRGMNDDQLKKVLQKNPDFAKALGLPDNIMTMPAEQRDNLIKSRLEPQFKPTDGTLAAPGTSFSSPEIAGVAADLVQAAPTAGPDGIKDSLTSTAHDMGNFTPNQQGHGFADAFAALQKLQRGA